MEHDRKKATLIPTVAAKNSIKIKYPYTKPQPPTPFNSNSHPSHFCTKLWSKTLFEISM